MESIMLNIEISNREVAAPGLYIMRWKGKTGLVRIVGEPKRGFQLISPKDGAEVYMDGLPDKGQIPGDALFSEALAVVPV